MKSFSVFVHLLIVVFLGGTTFFLFQISTRLNSLPTVNDIYIAQKTPNIKVPDYVKRMPIIRLEGGDVDANITDTLDVRIQQNYGVPLEVEVTNKLLEVRPVQ